MVNRGNTFTCVQLQNFPYNRKHYKLVVGKNESRKTYTTKAITTTAKATMPQIRMLIRARIRTAIKMLTRVVTKTRIPSSKKKQNNNPEYLLSIHLSETTSFCSLSNRAISETFRFKRSFPGAIRSKRR